MVLVQGWPNFSLGFIELITPARLTLLLLFSFIPSFDDGFGGGSVLTKNVIANACRESSDHGKELGGALWALASEIATN
jgi:hypothetical protein